MWYSDTMHISATNKQFHSVTQVLYVYRLPDLENETIWQGNLTEQDIQAKLIVLDHADPASSTISFKVSIFMMSK
jgi:hypothetical protein